MSSHYTHLAICYSHLGNAMLDCHITNLGMVGKLFDVDKGIREIEVTNLNSGVKTMYQRPIKGDK